MKSFTFNDLAAEAEIQDSIYHLDGRNLGLRVSVPSELHHSFPFNVSAYQWMQQLRQEILAEGIIELPGLPVNKRNYTLAQRAPQQHSYSSNQYLTDLCQQPHQDTPPYPTAFWLPAQRLYSATWVMGVVGVKAFNHAYQQLGGVQQVHQALVQRSLQEQFGLLLNQQPGLLLIDNSDACHLFHARTCLFNNLAMAEQAGKKIIDTPMYAFNEVGLLNYINQLDSRRGQNDRDATEQRAVEAFMQQEQLPQLLMSLREK